VTLDNWFCCLYIQFNASYLYITEVLESNQFGTLFIAATILVELLIYQAKKIGTLATAIPCRLIQLCNLTK